MKHTPQQTSAQLNKLHLGCGEFYKEGWTNVDSPWTTVKADLYIDLDIKPWPLLDNNYNFIEMFAVIEHLHDPLKVLAELHRILKPGGRVHIYTGYFKCDDAFLDLTHVSFFHEQSMRFVEEGNPYSFYSHVRFKVISAKLTSQNDTLAKKLRNLLPFRFFLTKFFWNMYDGVDYVLEKPH